MRNRRSWIPRRRLDHQGHVDGYQHLFHLMQVTVDFYLHNDPLRPRLMRLTDGTRKLYGDNVDAVYYFSQVRGDQEYVIRGRRFDSCYLSFCLYGGDPNGELADRVTLNVNHRDIAFNDDGSFAIRLTPDPKGPNEFRIEPDSVSLFTREYFFDRASTRESILSIQNASPQPPALPLGRRRTGDAESAAWRCSSCARGGSLRCRSTSRSTSSARRGSSTRTRGAGGPSTTSTVSAASDSRSIST